MQILKNTPEEIVIRTEENEPLLNAIRRSVSEIPILAIDEVEIYKNDSALYDEVLAHRFGLVPLKTEKSMNSKTKVELKLSKTGPGTVYSGDLQGPIEIPYPKIPLTILNKGHKLELSATATLGLGTEHAKYVPGIFYYRHLAEVKSSPEVDKIVQSSTTTEFKPEKKGSKWLCDLSDAESVAIEAKNKDSIEDSKEMIVVIESFGQMNAQDILQSAVKSLSSNLDDFEKQIK